MEGKKPNVIVYQQSKRSSMEYSPKDSSSKRVKAEENEVNDANDGEVTLKREVYCAKCKNHGVLAAKKGHKGKCVRETCKCPKCVLIDERREVLRLQVMKQRQCKREAIQMNQLSHESNTGDRRAPVRQDANQAAQSSEVSNAVSSNESPQRQQLSFPTIVKNYNILHKYLSATLPLREEIYRLAVLDLCDNDPIRAFQHLMKTNAKFDCMRKTIDATRNYQQNATNISFNPLASSSTVQNQICVTSASGLVAPVSYYSPLKTRATLLSHSARSAPYIPSVTTFRPLKITEAVSPNTFNYGYPMMGGQKAPFSVNICCKESNEEEQIQASETEYEQSN